MSRLAPVKAEVAVEVANNKVGRGWVRHGALLKAGLELIGIEVGWGRRGEVERSDVEGWAARVVDLQGQEAAWDRVDGPGQKTLVDVVVRWGFFGQKTLRILPDFDDRKDFILCTRISQPPDKLYMRR